MRRKQLIYYLGMMLFLVFACGDSEPYQDAEDKVKVVVDSLTENRYAFLNAIVENNGNLYVKVDYVDYLTGKEAFEAEWRDQAYFIDGVDTISNITNGYYISNVNPKIRTFKIGSQAKIENIIFDNGLDKMRPFKDLNSKQLQEYIDMQTLLMFYVENGIVKRIDERFMP